MRNGACTQSVVFKLDYVLEAAAGRPEFGTVLLDKKNVAEEMVAQGMAKVCHQGTHVRRNVRSASCHCSCPSVLVV